MKILVLGQGGREHALLRALHHTSHMKHNYFCVPGSDAIGEWATCVPLALEDIEGIVNFAREQHIELAIIGPEQPLVDGVADRLREAGVRVFGPSREAARLEGSKIFAKEFMVRAGVPTARYEIVESMDDVRSALVRLPAPCVFKVDGLAAGKGVYICQTPQDVMTAAAEVFIEKRFGRSGERALIEGFLHGWELSYLILTNGQSYKSLILAQDHKRLQDHDAGPNTGGMGTVAPVFLSPDLQSRIDLTILKPVTEQLAKEGFDYRGVLFIGLMVTESGPQVLEFNVRFGDPECQVILPLLDGDWSEVFASVAGGDLPSLQWKSSAAACVVMAAEGYPGSPKKNVTIEGHPLFQNSTGYFLHAGTARRGNEWVTAGGRVLNAIGLGEALDIAIDNAYKVTKEARWSGLQMRYDIGKKLQKK